MTIVTLCLIGALTASTTPLDASPAPSASDPAPAFTGPAPAAANFLAHVPGVVYSGAGGSQPTVRIVNWIPEFLAFHDEVRRLEAEARQEAEDRNGEVDPAEISRILRDAWDRHLEELGSRASRAPGGVWEPVQLDEAWSRYGGEMDRIRAAAEGITPAPGGVLQSVAGQLRLDRPLEVEVLVYVGTFQEQPAFRLGDGEYSILLPVETLPQATRPLLIDLFTRAVHARLSGRPADGRLTLAQHLFLRGLALRVYEATSPGRPAQTYLLRSRDSLLSAERRDGEILDGMRARLAERDPEALARWVDGVGTGDFDYAAWRVSGLLLMDGWSLERLARIPVDEVQGVVAEILGVR